MITNLYKDDVFLHHLKQLFPINNLKNKAVLIGNSGSIMDYSYGKLIDEVFSQEYSIIRINRYPLSQYYNNYGQKTDIVISYCKSINDVIQQYYEENNIKVPELIVLNSDAVKQCKLYFKNPNIPCLHYGRRSTGFAAIAYLMSLVDELVLFGFKGDYSNKIYDSPLIKEPVAYPTSGGGYHNVIEEHRIIEYFVKTYHPKIKQLEDMNL